MKCSKRRPQIHTYTGKHLGYAYSYSLMLIEYLTLVVIVHLAQWYYSQLNTNWPSFESIKLVALILENEVPWKVHSGPKLVRKVRAKGLSKATVWFYTVYSYFTEHDETKVPGFSDCRVPMANFTFFHCTLKPVFNVNEWQQLLAPYKERNFARLVSRFVTSCSFWESNHKIWAINEQTNRNRWKVEYTGPTKYSKT